jgi:CrcB protein
VTPRPPWGTLAAVSAGGALGALARFGLTAAWPAPPGRLPWATFAVNVSGCLLIGVLLGLLAGARSEHPLLRPFLAVGVLGGYTTFAGYAVDGQRLLTAAAAGTAALYLAGTLAAALAAVAAGEALARLATGRLRRGGDPVGAGVGG